MEHKILKIKIELLKLKKTSTGKTVEDWLNFINAEKKEVLMDLELSTKIPEVKDVIGELSADEKLRREAFYSILKIEFLTIKKTRC